MKTLVIIDEAEGVDLSLWEMTRMIPNALSDGGPVIRPPEELAYVIDYEAKTVRTTDWDQSMTFEELAKIIDQHRFIKTSMFSHQILRDAAVVFMVARDQLMDEGYLD